MSPLSRPIKASRVCDRTTTRLTHGLIHHITQEYRYPEVLSTYMTLFHHESKGLGSGQTT
ncbi:hypothetical protein DFR70_12057 [Nocardia tenerifensis]|uniref:Uncharacterized protein n=1 Tax=Nocardia tenerifensis TaxID=228006 RepID=A0A318JUL0_9NOCA|nr:hypothetical protein DFR70_12057 [Nocardia tenerifensis]